MSALFITLLLLFSLPAVAGEVTVSSFGVTYHGLGVSEEIAEKMPYKLTSNGDYVYHPVNFTLRYKDDDNQQFVLTYLKDCFDMQAGVIGIGHHWTWWRLGIGYLSGVYVREKLYFTNAEGRVVTTEDLPNFIENNGIQYIPLVFLTSSLRLKVSEPYIDLLFAGNVYLNHLELGVAFGW